MAGKARGRHREKALTALAVRSARRPGRYADGGGLYLYVKESGARSWVLRVTVNGRRQDIGLGSVSDASLVEAREAAARYRSAIRGGEDPLTLRRKAAGIPTFEEAATVVHASHSEAWRNSKHRAQWLNSLRDHAFPVIGKRSVDQIDSSDVLKVLAPIWLTKPETARRVRQRIRTVLDWARGAGHREGENPVGPVLDKALPKQLGRVGHHAALPYAEVPAFIESLRERPASEVTRIAFEFLILTAARTGDVIGARWGEIDLKAATWTIPAARMKAGREHRVPLSRRALEVLHRARELAADSEIVFPGMRLGRPLSNMAFLMLLRRMGRGDLTAHGFRSAFRDWAAEATGFPAEVAEMALAHAISDKTEAAYRRGDLFEKRCRLMEAWAAYATGGTLKVLAIRGGANGG